MVTQRHGLLTDCPPGNPRVADSYVGIANAFLRPLGSGAGGNIGVQLLSIRPSLEGETAIA